MGLSSWLKGRGFEDAPDRKPDLSLEKGKRLALQRWHRDHPLCATLGCEPCPFHSNDPAFNASLIPGCNHPDVEKGEYRP